jgi:superfamily II DNA helicase RecQ
MHSYADQRTHGFFLNRDYPPVEHLNKVFAALGTEPLPVEEQRALSELAEEEFDKALEKLEIHGGAHVDFGGAVTKGASGWQKSYTVQAQYRAEQFENVVRFADAGTCRMSQLVRHFGDVKDAGHSCGICDICDPAGAVLRCFRRATAAERIIVQAMVDELRQAAYIATGTLQRKLELVDRMSRDQYEALLGAMVCGGLIEIEEAAFEKNGEVLRFRKVMLTEAGRDLSPTTSLELLIEDGIVEEFGSSAALSRSSKPAKPIAQKSAAVAALPLQSTPASEALAAQLREWRTAEAKRLKVPSYVVLHNRTLLEVALARPANPAQLLAIDGIGPTKVERFGEAILKLCASRSG